MSLTDELLYSWWISKEDLTNALEGPHSLQNAMLSFLIWTSLLRSIELYVPDVPQAILIYEVGWKSLENSLLFLGQYK